MHLIREVEFRAVRGGTDMDHIRNEDIRGNERQYTYNVKLGCVRTTIVVVKNQYVLLILMVCL
jgi:hypothetical protein